MNGFVSQITFCIVVFYFYEMKVDVHLLSFWRLFMFIKWRFLLCVIMDLLFICWWNGTLYMHYTVTQIRSQLCIPLWHNVYAESDLAHCDTFSHNYAEHCIMHIGSQFDTFCDIQLYLCIWGYSVGAFVQNYAVCAFVHNYAVCAWTNRIWRTNRI